MTTTVHKLAYHLEVNALKFDKGMKGSRTELAMVKREMRAMLTPAEKWEVKLNQLGAAAKKNAKLQGVYDRALRQSRKELTKSAKTTGDFTKRMVAAGAAYLSFRTVLTAGRAISNEIGRLDALGKSAKNVGASPEFISGLEFVTGRISGFGSGQATKAIEKMMTRITRETSEAATALKTLKLTFDDVQGISPSQAFFKIRDAAQELGDFDKVRNASVALFDDEQAGVVTTLMLQTAEYDKQISKAKQFGQILTTAQAAKASAAKDQLDDFNAAFGGLKKEAAIASTPVTQFAADAIPAWRRFGAGLASAQGGSFSARLGSSMMSGSMQQQMSGNRPPIRLVSSQKRRDEINSARDSKAKAAEAKAFSSGLFSGLRESVVGGVAGAASSAALRGRAALMSAQIASQTSIGRASRQAQTQTSFQQVSADPMASIAAGGSASFRLQNQVKSSESVAVTLQKKSVKEATITNVILERIAEAVDTGQELIDQL